LAATLTVACTCAWLTEALISAPAQTSKLTADSIVFIVYGFLPSMMIYALFSRCQIRRKEGVEPRFSPGEFPDASMLSATRFLVYGKLFTWHGKKAKSARTA
jgi:hypothetical protein